MKVLLINGSPHREGITAIALREVQKTLETDGIETELIHIGHKDIHGCIACYKCYTTGKCVFNDVVNEIAPKFEAADGLIVGTPVYYAAPAGTVVSFMNRLFYSTHFDKTMKVGASVVVARRGGCSASFDVLNKYFYICGMPIATSQYWNSVHGREPGEAVEDLEGMQTMRTLGHNMAFLLKSIAIGKQQFGLPQKEDVVRTNFIR